MFSYLLLHTFSESRAAPVSRLEVLNCLASIFRMKTKKRFYATKCNLFASNYRRAFCTFQRLFTPQNSRLNISRKSEWKGLQLLDISTNTETIVC